MTERRISLVTLDPTLAPEISSGKPREAGSRTEILGGEASLTWSDYQKRRAFPLTESVEFVITFGAGVSSGVVANWLYDTLKGRCSWLRIGNRKVEVEPGDIQKALEAPDD